MAQHRSREQVITIEGGRELNGHLCVSGSKNASLPIMAAALLTAEPVVLENVPQIADTVVMGEILRGLGAEVGDADGQVTIEARDIRSSDVPEPIARRMRASIVLLGPLLARTGQARVPRPGGDEIGARRVEQHIAGFRRMGATVEERDGEFVATAQRLKGARIILDLPTVTGTENIMMGAALAEGRTEILNAAREPHVQDLARFLQRLGVGISGAGTDVIQVDGIDRARGARHRVIPDYLEAGTYAIAAAATGGDVALDCSPPEDLTNVLLKLQEAGAEVEWAAGFIRVRRPKDRPLRCVDLTTWVHPGFPTDLQAQFTALMTQAQGLSIISEYIFENRFQHIHELVRMGADIEMSGRTAFVRGPAHLRGTSLVIPDIRAGASLVIAALCAEGRTELHHPWHVDRGYENLPGKLASLGASIERGGPAGGRASESGSYE